MTLFNLKLSCLAAGAGLWVFADLALAQKAEPLVGFKKERSGKATSDPKPMGKLGGRTVKRGETEAPKAARPPDDKSPRRNPDDKPSK